MRETWRALGAAILTLTLGACTCAETGGEPASLDRTPPERPDGWLFELAVGDAVDSGDARLGELRARLPEGSLRTFFPSRVADLLDQVVTLPAGLAQRIAEDSPLRCIVVRPEADTTRTACAVRLSSVPPALSPGAPRGGSWIGDEPLAVAGDVLIVGEDRAVVERTLAWLAFGAITSEEPSAVRLTVAEDAAGAILRPLADDATTSYARDARQEVERERGAHAAPPTFGEPEALIAAVESAARERIALLPDVGALTITLDTTPQGLVLRASAAVRDASPLHERLAAMPGSAPTAMRAIPEGTVLAWLSRASTEERARMADELVQVVAPIAGARLTVEDRAILTGAIAQWAGARGEQSIAAIGVGRDGLWAALASDRASALSLEPIAAALTTAWSQTLLAERLGCESLRPDAWITEGGESRVALCARARLASSQIGDAIALSLETSAAAPEHAPIAHELAAALEAGASGRGSSVDLDRELGSLGGEPIFLAVVAPSLLARALHGAVESTAHAPVALLAVTYVEHTLSIQLRASTAAIEDLASVEELLGSL